MMEVKKLDKVALSLLRFLNQNSHLKPKTLAEVFNETYQDSLGDSVKTLSYLSNHGYINIKLYDDVVKMIYVEHLGKNYEAILTDELIEKKKAQSQDNKFKIITILLSGLVSLIVSIIVNLLFK